MADIIHGQYFQIIFKSEDFNDIEIAFCTDDKSIRCRDGKDGGNFKSLHVFKRFLRKMVMDEYEPWTCVYHNRCLEVDVTNYFADGTPSLKEAVDEVCDWLQMVYDNEIAKTPADDDSSDDDSSEDED